MDAKDILNDAADKIESGEYVLDPDAGWGERSEEPRRCCPGGAITLSGTEQRRAIPTYDPDNERDKVRQAMWALADRIPSGGIDHTDRCWRVANWFDYGQPTDEQVVSKLREAARSL